MKQLLLILSSLWMTCAYATFNSETPTPEKIALATQLAKVDNSKQMLEVTVQKVITQTKNSFPPNTPEIFFTTLEKNIDQQKMLNDLIKASSTTYSIPELKALIAFYQTSEGKKVAEKYPDMVVKIADLSGGFFQEALQKTVQQLKDGSP